MNKRKRNVLLVSMIALLAITGNIFSENYEELKRVTASKDLIEQVEKAEIEPVEEPETTLVETTKETDTPEDEISEEPEISEVETPKEPEKPVVETKKEPEKQIVETPVEPEKSEKPVAVSTEKQESLVTEPTRATTKKSTLPMTMKLLPAENSEVRIKETTHIVLHFSSNALAKPQDPYNVNDVYQIFKDHGVSSHYMIDRAGKIYQLTDENRVAYHAGPVTIKGFPEYDLGLNHYSIGIELLAIGTKEEMIPVIGEAAFNQIDPSLVGYTEEQYITLNQLINDIIARNPGIQKNRLQIVGHDEYTNRKTDPGSLFDWSKIGF